MWFRRKKVCYTISEAKMLLDAAKKVKNYRGDLFTDVERKCLDTAIDDFLKSETIDEAKAAAENLKDVLLGLGGTIFPQKGIMEWVELIIVAAILAGGIRGFFFQLFKIPTNSMFPTYNGMTAEVYSESINPLKKCFERVFYSASFYECTAPADGEVSFCVKSDNKSVQENIFEFLIGNTPLKVECPRDFSMSSVLLDKFFPEFSKMEMVNSKERFLMAIKTAEKSGKIFKTADGSIFVKTGNYVKKGENFLNFKIFGGDMVVVNRFIYHFKKPEIGDPFVFRTKNISGLKNVDLYYVKRLAGVSGDKLVVKDNKLYRNGNIISGSEVFDKNNSRIFSEQYYGYFPTTGSYNFYEMPLNNEITVPEGYYYALGDNSSNSYDSRGWGCLPEKDAVGRASFIIYPFSKRFGLAK